METETETAQQPYVHPTSRWLTWCDECKCHTEDSDHSHTPQCIACGTER